METMPFAFGLLGVAAFVRTDPPIKTQKEKGILGDDYALRLRGMVVMRIPELCVPGADNDLVMRAPVE